MMPENKGLSIFNKVQFLSLFIIFALIFPMNAFSNAHEGHSDSSVVSNSEHQAGHEASHEAAFNPGDMILDHVKDAHDWHIMDIGGHAVVSHYRLFFMTMDFMFFLLLNLNTAMQL